MALTWAEVILVAPELAGLSVNTQNAILANVARQVNATAWGDKANDGMVYLAAHLGTLTKRKGAGPVTMEKLGAMERGYGMIPGHDALALTAYGVEYERMIKLLPVALGAVF